MPLRISCGLIWSLTAITFSGCGFFGMERLVEKARSPKVLAENELTKEQEATLTDRAYIDDEEFVIFFYDTGGDGQGKEGNLLTTRRMIQYDEDQENILTFDEIVSAEHELGGTSERLRLERPDGGYMVMTFGLTADSIRMYQSLCKKIESKCTGSHSWTE